MKQDASYDAEYGGFYAEALSDPVPWYRMDSDFPTDPKVRKLGVMGGWAYIGMWQVLNACLAREEGHMFDVSEDLGWRFLQAAMCSGGLQIGLKDLSNFVSALLSIGLLDKALYEESGKLASERMMREVDAYAKNVASGKVKALKMRRSK